MITALISGSLFRNPERRTSKSGKQFAAATVRVKTGEAMLFIRVMVFSERPMAELMRLSDGDTMSAQGSFKAEIYAKNGGAPKLSLSIIADQILALRRPPKESKPKTPELGLQDTRPRQQRCAG
jgi:single-stranded DNA-binding protein